MVCSKEEKGINKSRSKDKRAIMGVLCFGIRPFNIGNIADVTGSLLFPVPPVQSPPLSATTSAVNASRVMGLVKGISTGHENK
jgi:hypothetical protein